MHSFEQVGQLHCCYALCKIEGSDGECREALFTGADSRGQLDGERGAESRGLGRCLVIVFE